MRVLVLGAAVSGRAAAELLGGEGHDVSVFDENPAVLSELDDQGFVLLGGEWTTDHLTGIDLVVASPGFAEHSPPIQDSLRSGVTLWSELEAAARRLTVPMAAVTGTNGKTTVTRLATQMLAASGLEAVAAGNVGLPLSAVVGGDWDVVVVEASSFQLRFVEDLLPSVAVMLNVASDHLDWHGTIEAYAAAKARVFENQGPDELLVYDADDPGATRAVLAAGTRLLPISGTRRPEGGNGVDQGKMWLGATALEVPPHVASDPAYLVDVVAAGTVALELGAGPDAVADTAYVFQPGEHRRALVGTWDGVDWVDDSKATNPHAAIGSALAYPSVVLIAGGRNKGLDLAPVAAISTVHHLVAIGEAASELTAIAPQASTAASLEEAVAVADGIALPGDTVLLAPACASFDMFESYAARGEAFAEAIRALKGRST